MFSKIIQNFYGISLVELVFQSIDAFIFLVTMILVLVAAYKVYRKTKAKSAFTIVCSLFGCIVSAFVSSVVYENSISFGYVEFFVHLLPSAFGLVAAYGFYKFCGEFTNGMC